MGRPTFQPPEGPPPAAPPMGCAGSDSWADVHPHVCWDSPHPHPVALGHVTCVSLSLSFPLCRPEANPGGVRLAMPSTQVWPEVTISSI